MAEEDVDGGVAAEGEPLDGEGADDEFVAPGFVEPPPRKTTGQYPQARPQPVEDVAIPANLMRASDLPGGEMPEPAELGLEPNDYYKGFKILRDLPVQDERHAYLFDPATVPGGHVRAFYVLHEKGEGQSDMHHDVIGLVPWLGSTVIWPWELAWTQDLYHEKQDPQRQALMAAFVKSKEKK